MPSKICNGVSLARSVELTAQWGRIVALGPVYPVSLDDLHAVQGLGLGDFFRVVSGIHRRLNDFIHSVVVHRRDEATRGGVVGCGRILWFILTSGLGLIWFSPQLFFSVSLILRLVVLRFSLIWLGLTKNSERPGFPTFAALGKGIPALRKSM